MPRKVKALPGPSRLSGILSSLRQEPRPALSAVKRLTLSYAAKNDHFGARHFVKDDLPRIKYANPNVHIEVNPLSGRPWGSFVPEMVIEHEDGKTRKINLEMKWSSTILAELLDAAGTPEWTAWKAQRKEAGLPVLDGINRKVVKTPWQPRAAPLAKGKSKVEEPEGISAEVEADIEKARSGTGARAILP